MGEEIGPVNGFKGACGLRSQIHQILDENIATCQYVAGGKERNWDDGFQRHRQVLVVVRRIVSEMRCHDMDDVSGVGEP